jgi:LacI family transcriptional regulator
MDLASRRLTPSLTTISQHGVEIGEVAAKLLIDRLESKEENFLMKQLSLKQN